MNRQLTQSLEAVLVQIREMLVALTDDQYRQNIPVLSGASLGEHVRHLIEFFIELDKGYELDNINYGARCRDKLIEQHRDIALARLHLIPAILGRKNKSLTLITDSGVLVTTNYERELAYNLEHTVHHMALLKIGITAITGLSLPENFGVADSTIRYHQTLYVHSNFHPHQKWRPVDFQP